MLHRSPLFPIAFGVLAMALPGSAAAMTAGNLVVAGDGETPPAAAWTITGGPLERSAYGSAHYPADPVLFGGGALNGGAYVLHGSGPETTATQAVALSTEDVEAISTGTVRARLSASLGGYLGQEDRVSVEVAWRDADGATVLRQRLDPITPAERGGTTAFVRRAAEDAIPAAARSAVVTVHGERLEGTAQDGWFDDLALRLIGVPQPAPTLAAARAHPGDAVPLTLTVKNSEDLEAKPPWSFVVRIPRGLDVAASIPARSTCTGGTVEAAGGVVRLSGSTAAGPPSCAFSLAVVAAEPGTFSIGADDFTDLRGVRAPTAAARLTVDAGPATAPQPGAPLPPAAVEVPPAAGAPVPPPPAPQPAPQPAPVVPPAPPARRSPSLRLAESSGDARRGRAVRLRAVVRNTRGATATDVDVCVALPAGSAVLPRPADGRRVEGGRCWTVRRLPVGGRASVALTVRPRRSARTLSVRWRADAAETHRTTTTRQSIRIAP